MTKVKQSFKSPREDIIEILSKFWLIPICLKYVCGFVPLDGCSGCWIRIKNPSLDFIHLLIWLFEGY
ncbi:hypothetical protein CMV_029276 [Castanea mollissima]|uniref:Uncharacterized protein n=1 Tax=Castanea mollissima TaxID=60419 RepID=A0A8J4QAN5_9ROSI|nr:hypothetical protein CMV_029276 [Castanea mollissima]